MSLKSSQSRTVERIHKEIRKGLLYILLEDTKNFNIKKALKKVMNNYNNTVHVVTKYTPNEIFYTSNEELLKNVYNNTYDYYNNRIKNENNSIIFNIGQKFFINNNAFISKKRKFKLNIFWN